MPIVDRRPKSRIDITEIMETWAREGQGRIDGGLGYPKQVLLGKIMDGMPGTNCPKCSGSGKVTIDAPGIARMRVDCPVCDGAGRVKLDCNPSKVNPAFITGNGQRLTLNINEQSQRVDWLVCTAITEDQRCVVVQEFLRPGNKYMKMRKLGIKLSTYDELLNEALKIISEGLDF